MIVLLMENPARPSIVPSVMGLVKRRQGPLDYFTAMDLNDLAMQLGCPT
jgi:hypothetical protein